MNITTKYVLPLFVIIILASCQISDSKYDVVTEKNVMIPMSDGINLAANISIPKSNGKFPVILIRTPYGKDADEDEPGDFWAEKGYVFVIQDCRGTNKSDGEWNPGFNEYQDGIDTRNWIIAQEWCDGKIGTYGGSYLGYTQFVSATDVEKPPEALFAIIPLLDWHKLAYIGGAYSLGINFTWGAEMASPKSGEGALIDEDTWDWEKAYRKLPLIDMDQTLGVKLPWMRRWIENPVHNQNWAPYTLSEYIDKMQTPVITISGWYDIFVNQALDYYSNAILNNKKHHYLIVGPWGHGPNYPAGDRDFGENQSLPLENLEVVWFDYWLKDKPLDFNSLSAVKLFVMGKNEWRNENEWPLRRTKYVNYYLDSEGKANTVKGDGSLSMEVSANNLYDSYMYDPENPVKTNGGPILFYEFGAFDQKDAESREDVLVYTSDVIESELEVTGPVNVILYASTDGRDTDWTAKLVDVYLDGRAFNLCEGIIRARFNVNPAKPLLINPNKINKYKIDMWATSNVFLPGHKIRLEISSSNFPRFDRNPNTGNTFGMDTELRTAHQKVYHSKEYPSHIVLPVIPVD
jgi:putative CocE/NonD family hydrolase